VTGCAIPHPYRKGSAKIRACDGIRTRVTGPVQPSTTGTVNSPIRESQGILLASSFLTAHSNSSKETIERCERRHAAVSSDVIPSAFKTETAPLNRQSRHSSWPSIPQPCHRDCNSAFGFGRNYISLVLLRADGPMLSIMWAEIADSMLRGPEGQGCECQNSILSCVWSGESLSYGEGDERIHPELCSCDAML
jgi:hypothetical protein